MPDDTPKTPAEQQALNAELRADYRNARLRDQHGERFKLFQPDAPAREPATEPTPEIDHDHGMER